MTAPDLRVAQLVKRLDELGWSAPASVPDASITLAKLAPDVVSKLGAGGGGGAVTVDPDDPDFLIATGGNVAPDPADPDYLTFA